MAHIDDPQTQRANLSFIQASMRAPMLSREHEQTLARRWRDEQDEAALHELIRSYTRLVVAMAGRFRHFGLPMGDLVQEGNVGLMQAASRFDPTREVRFSTYAAWWIKSAMQDFVLRNWSMVRTGTTAAQKSLFFNLRRLRARIEKATGAPLDDAGRARIAEELGVGMAEVEAMEQRLAAADQSLNVALPDRGVDWQDLIADDRPTPEAVVIGLRDAQARSRWLAAALGELTPRERQIIGRRRLSDESATLEELGRALGVSKERVRQLEGRALSKLREAMRKCVAEPGDLLVEG